MREQITPKEVNDIMQPAKKQILEAFAKHGWDFRVKEYKEDGGWDADLYIKGNGENRIW